MVVDTQPRVLVAQVPERHVLDDILMLTEDFEDTVVLVFLNGSDIGSLWLSLTT